MPGPITGRASRIAGGEQKILPVSQHVSQRERFGECGFLEILRGYISSGVVRIRQQIGPGVPAPPRLSTP